MSCRSCHWPRAAQGLLPRLRGGAPRASAAGPSLTLPAYRPRGDPRGPRKTQGAGAWAEPGGTLLRGETGPPKKTWRGNSTLPTSTRLSVSLRFSLSFAQPGTGSDARRGLWVLFPSWEVSAWEGWTLKPRRAAAQDRRDSGRPHLARMCPGKFATMGGWGTPGWGCGLGSRERFRLQTRFSACSQTEFRVRKGREGWACDLHGES